MKLRKLKLKFKNKGVGETMFGSEVVNTSSKLSRNDRWVENFEPAPTNPGTGDELVQTRISNVIPQKTLSVFLIFILGVSSIIVLRAFYLQIFSGDTYRAIAEGNRIREIPILPKRGLIYDSAGEEIATNLPLFLLTIHGPDLPTDEEERIKVFTTISNLGLPISYNGIKDELISKPRINIAELSYEDALVYMPVVQKLPGATVSLYERRNYLDAEVFSHIVGYLGPVTEDE